MTRLNRILKELIRNLYRNPGTALGSVLSLAMLFLLFDIFWIAAGTSNSFYAGLLSNLQMHVYVDEAIDDSALPELTDKIAELEGVSAVQFVSREMARRELASRVGTDLLVGYDSLNPLPRSYILAFSPSYLTDKSLSELKSKLLSFSEVMQVDYSTTWLQKAESTRFVVLNIGLVLGGLILFTTLVTSANSIRLMTRARNVGFWQMHLLGAGRLFLAMPFLLEGLFIGCFSAAIGWSIILYINNKISFTQFEIVMPTIEEIILYCLAAGLLGVVSGFLGIRKMLR